MFSKSQRRVKTACRHSSAINLGVTGIYVVCKAIQQPVPRYGGLYHLALHHLASRLDLGNNCYSTASGALKS
jgi:hypothetical protein